MGIQPSPRLITGRRTTMVDCPFTPDIPGSPIALYHARHANRTSEHARSGPETSQRALPTGPKRQSWRSPTRPGRCARADAVVHTASPRSFSRNRYESESPRCGACRGGQRHSGSGLGACLPVRHTHRSPHSGRGRGKARDQQCLGCFDAFDAFPIAAG